MDCKRLTDRRVTDLAAKVREVCGPKRFAEVEIPPEAYNRLYGDMKREGKNLNALLAWGHVRVMENVLKQTPCHRIIADQFGDERLIRSRLKVAFPNRKINLIQRHGAEDHTAVAAASVLARARFLAWMTRTSERYGMTFPKGASAAVTEAARALVAKQGPEELRKVAKLHFRTTQEVLKTRTDEG
jgi:ribonuclease HIII